MTNDEIKANVNEIYNGWWKKYRNISPITEAVMDEAYDSGKSIVDRLKSQLVFDIWKDLMRELEKRWKKEGKNT